MNVKTIAINDIDAGDRMQSVDPRKSEALSASIERKGIIEPIIVRPFGHGFKLIAGAHRLAAVVLLGWEELIVGLNVIIREEETEEDAMITEIYENIFRSQPTAFNYGRQLCAAKEIHDKRRGETRGRKPKIEKLQEDKKVFKDEIIFSDRFTVEAAKSIGLSPVAISEYIRVFKGVMEVDAECEVLGTMVEDNLNELKQLVAIPVEHRRAAAAAIKRGEAKKVTEALAVVGLEKRRVDDQQVKIKAQIVELWGKASELTKAEILHDLGLQFATRKAKR